MNRTDLEARRVDAKLAVAASIQVGDLEAAAEQMKAIEELDEQLRQQQRPVQQET